jgi:phosphoribosylaminoimidazolecarboxamide formyltransferase/IMP cyclohydrolase
MSIRDMEGTVDNLIPVKNIIVSTFDKSGFDFFIPELIKMNPDLRVLSTGGSYIELKSILGSDADRNLTSIADYTGFPEMEGGLVKTIHPKIHAGILGERNNPEHIRYLKEELGDAVFIDMVVGNLYPFEEVIAEPKTTFEMARGNIDIGGPTMIRGAAKNFPSCAAVCDPADYEKIIEKMKKQNGCTNFPQRFELAEKVWFLTEKYDLAIGNFWSRLSDEFPEKIMACYKFSEDVKNE